MSGDGLRIFSLHETRALTERIATALEVPVSPLEERAFDGGEHKSRPLASVRGDDVYVIQSLHGDAELSANDKLCRLLFLIGTLLDSGARRVTAVLPYLCYSRKDRRTKPRDPVTTRYVAMLLEAVGTHCVLTVDVHNSAAYQNAFRCQCEHLEAAPLFVDHYCRTLSSETLLTVVSPDVGGIKRAQAFRMALAHARGDSVGMAFVEKYRSRDELSGGALVGEVEGRGAILYDDIISSGATLGKAAAACRAAGAAAVYAAATHGLFNRQAIEVLQSAAIEEIVVTDSAAGNRAGELAARVRVIDCAPLLAESVRRLHTHGSLIELLDPSGEILERRAGP
ncbi:MAG: ribose-phosphate diphosphokinase [Gammaproteobacteria bacterium]|nr:ribose-phosphate diphosphokinase [Gammaproteobacteria bacterium]